MSVVLAGPAAVQRAIDFARLAGVRSIAAWMVWGGWQLYVGCDRCIALGQQASCWGRVGCHGWQAGCGCRDCAQRQARELAHQDHGTQAA